MKQHKPMTVGNAGNITKRQAFKAGKEQRAPLADTITAAFEARGRARAGAGWPGIPSRRASRGRRPP
mgnify:CR=1 FL=1